MKDTKFKRIQCLDRALDILNAVATGHCRTVNEIASLVGLNQSTVYNIVKTLEARRFIDCQDGSYAIGSSLGLMANSWDLAGNIPHLAKPILEEVAEKTGEGVCVTMLAGLHAEIINMLPGARQVSVQFVHRTWRYPLNLGTGRLLVALGNPADWERHIQRHLKDAPKNLGERGWDQGRWERHFEELRRQGFVILRISSGEQDGEDIGAVAAPLRSRSGALVGVLGSSCPAERASEKHLASMKDSIVAAIAKNPL